MHLNVLYTYCFDSQRYPIVFPDDLEVRKLQQQIDKIVIGLIEEKPQNNILENEDEESNGDMENEDEQSNGDMENEDDGDMENEDEENNGDMENEDESASNDFTSPSELWHALESQEVEIGHCQIEIERLKQEIEDLEYKNQSLKEQNQRVIYIMQSRQNDGNRSLMMAINELKLKLHNCTFGASMIKDDDRKTCFYTGLPSYQQFLALFKLLQPLIKPSSGQSLMDELLIVLVKLRLGVPNEDLAYRLNISHNYVSMIFQKWLTVMSRELQCLIAWPDEEKLHENMPSSFRKHYSRTKCIIDCFEIFVDRPTYFEARASTYSNYKKHNTVKVLIAVSPVGSICFISKAWGGRVSDKVITQQSGFLDHINYGDVVMADRGFNIQDDLAVRGAELLIPAFTRQKKQLTNQEVETTRKLARLRIHVERVIGQLRKKYKILKNTLPISLLKSPSDEHKVLCTIDRIIIVTAALTNLSPSVVT